MGGFARRMSYFNAFVSKYPSRPFMRLDGTVPDDPVMCEFVHKAQVDLDEFKKGK